MKTERDLLIDYIQWQEVRNGRERLPDWIAADIADRFLITVPVSERAVEERAIAEAFGDWIIWSGWIPHGLPLRSRNLWHQQGQTITKTTAELFAIFQQQQSKAIG